MISKVTFGVFISLFLTSSCAYLCVDVYENKYVCVCMLSVPIICHQKYELQVQKIMRKTCNRKGCMKANSKQSQAALELPSTATENKKENVVYW